MRDAARKPWETAVPVGQAIRRRASESLDDAPHRPRLASYPPVGPTDRLPDLYGSLSRTFGISTEYRYPLNFRNGSRAAVPVTLRQGLPLDAKQT